MGKNTKIQDSIGQAMRLYKKSHGKTELWQHPAFLSALENSHNAIKSISVLKKHLPKKFHPLIRFSQPYNVWILSVKKGVTATQINLLLDDLSVRIARDIGYAPRFKVSIQTDNWNSAGFPLHYPTKTKITTPTTQEADEIISDFLQKGSFSG